MSWVVSEDTGFIQHVGDDNTGDIVRVFTQNGTLLAEAASTPLVPLSKPDQRGGGVDPLLECYIGRGGRRVILLDQHGSRWLGRITGTRRDPRGTSLVHS